MSLYNSKRLLTPRVQIGTVCIGGGEPVRIQAMTNIDTADARAAAKQCATLAEAGAELVRVSVDSPGAARAVLEIRGILADSGHGDLPLIGDFHFNGHELLADYPDCARVLDKYRINPGNVGFGDRRDMNFEAILAVAKEYDKPVRIGVNWGSLDKALLTDMMNRNARSAKPKSDREVIIDAMIESALFSAAFAERAGLARNKIVLSVKMSRVQDMVAAYEGLTARMSRSPGNSIGKNMARRAHHDGVHAHNGSLPYALHLGLTEAGAGAGGIVASSAALAILLQRGIGDTIRISLTPAPGESRAREVEVCRHLLQSLGLRSFAPHVTSCPGCGRTDSAFFVDLAAQVNAHIAERMKIWKRTRPGIERLKVAVMGCVVNGPGESRHADIAISLPGSLEKPVAPVYINGKLAKTLTGGDIPSQFIWILDRHVDQAFPENPQ